MASIGHMTRMTRPRAVIRFSTVNDHHGQGFSGQQALDSFPFSVAARHKPSRTQVDVSAIVHNPISALSNFRGRYEDFQECFALWCKEEPHGAEGIYNTISRHMEDQIHVRLVNLLTTLFVLTMKAIRQAVRQFSRSLTCGRASMFYTASLPMRALENNGVKPEGKISGERIWIHTLQFAPGLSPYWRQRWKS